jgi:hypothetical protein
MCVSVINGEVGSDNQVAVHIFHSETHFLFESVPSLSQFCNRSFAILLLPATPSNGSSSLRKHFLTLIYIKCFYCFGPLLSFRCNCFRDTLCRLACPCSGISTAISGTLFIFSVVTYGILYDYIFLDSHTYVFSAI